VVDEHVPAPRVTHHLEVSGILVDVEHDADVLILDNPFEVGHLAHVGHGHRAFLGERKRRGSRATQHDDRPGLREHGERPVPLPHLVQVHGAVGEVDRDLEPAERKLAVTLEAARELSLCPARRDNVSDQFDGQADVFSNGHPSRVPSAP